MSDPRRPTDGELFRHFRPGAGRPETGPSKKQSSGKWQPPPLGNPQLTLLAFARTNLKDWEATALVRDIARWMNTPSGLVERHPDRASVDKAFRKLLYKMSNGEAEHHLRKLAERRSKARSAERGERDEQMRPRAEPTLAAFLATRVPRPHAEAIVRLIAHDLSVDYPGGADTDFERVVGRFAQTHLSDARAAQLLAELRRRHTLGLPWIHPDREALASQLMD